MSLLSKLGSLITFSGRFPWKGTARIGFGVRVFGRLKIRGQGAIVVGDRVTFDGTRAPIELHAAKGARIEIGADSRLEGGASIEALESVTIGSSCRIGAWCKILDNHFHPLRGDRLARPASHAVKVGAGVVMGERCVLLPGAHLEDGVHLGHGVVIGRRVPSGLFLEGSPPRRVGGSGENR